MAEFMEDYSRFVKCSIRIKTDISKVHRSVGWGYISAFHTDIGPIATGRIKCDANLCASQISSLGESDVRVHKPLLHDLNDFVLLDISANVVTWQKRIFQILDE